MKAGSFFLLTLYTWEYRSAQILKIDITQVDGANIAVLTSENYGNYSVSAL